MFHASCIEPKVCCQSISKRKIAMKNFNEDEGKKNVLQGTGSHFYQILSRKTWEETVQKKMLAPHISCSEKCINQVSHR